MEAKDTTSAELIRVALCAPGELWGGVEQFVETLAKHLTEVGVPLIVLVLFDGPLLSRLQQLGIPVHAVSGKGRYDPSTFFQMVKALRQHRTNVVHSHGYKATVLGAMAARLTRARLVRTEHGRLEPTAGVQRVRMRLNERLETLASRYGADGVVFVSRDVQRHSPSQGAAAIERVIYNGIDCVPVHDARDCPGDFDDDPETFKVGIVGRIVPVKGHTYLLQAFKNLRGIPKVRLYVFGEGPLEADCRRLTETEGITNLVRFMGFKANMRQYLSRLDLLAIPSLHEGLPYTLLESMYSRVPVIASNVGGLAEVIESGVNGMLVPAADPQALANGIEQLYGNPELRHSLRENAFATAVNGFLADKMTASYLDVYRAVLRS